MGTEKELSDLMNGIQTREERIRWHLKQGNYDIVAYLMPRQAVDLVKLHDEGMRGTFDHHYGVFRQIKKEYEKVTTI